MALTGERDAVELLEREQPLAQLAEHLREAAAGHGRLVLVGGEAGVGKTALIDAFIRQANIEVLRTSWDSLSTPAPLGPARDLAPMLGLDFGELGHGLEAREQVFRSVLASLGSRGAPTVVIGEDAHWADGASLEMLRFLGRRISELTVLIVVSYRDDEIGADHPLRLLLGDLATARTLHRLPVAPLSELAVRQLAEAAGQDATQLHRLMNGNPFFLAEILRAQAGLIPESVSDVVLARASRLSPEARAALDVAAVIGASFTTERFLAVAGPVLEEVDECIASGLLIAAEDDLQFRHALTRDALYSAMAPTRRRLLHSRVLLALRDEASHRPTLALLAHHAEGAGERARVLEYATAAAEEATRPNAHREAAAQYQRALRYADDLSGAERARLFDGLSTASYLSDQGEEAITARLESLGIWRKVGVPLEVGNSLRWLARLYWFQGRGEEAEEALSEALTILEASPPGRELALVCNTLAEIRMLDQDLDETLRWGQRALDLADGNLEPEIPIQALVNMGSVRLLFEDPGGERDLMHGLRLARAHGITEQAARALTNLAWSSMWIMRLADAERHFAAGLDFCQDHDLDFFHRYLRAGRATLWMHQGNWDAALAECQQLLQMPELSPLTRMMALVTVGQILARRGQDNSLAFLDEAQVLAEENGQLMRLGPVYAARAEAALLRSDHQKARQAIDAVRELVESHGHRWQRGEFSWFTWQLGEHSPLPGELAEPYALQLSGQSLAAAEAWRLRGCPYEEARALAASDDPSLVRVALETLERLGAMPARSAAAQRLRELGVHDVPLVRRGPLASTRANPAGLTQREVDVLTLVVEGLRNPDIATRLFLTPKTVSHHLTSIYAKLGVTTRTEAARAATRLGIAREN
ncbi:MAG: LuxR C-terminal-related transcriptional regulator [Thermomicrobiales bacterium]